MAWADPAATRAQLTVPDVRAGERVMLAFSGGLDTSVISLLLHDLGLEVYAFTADVGQGDDMEQLRQRAKDLGIAKLVVADLTQRFVEEQVTTSVRFQAHFEGRYLLGTALARPLIAEGMAKAAIEHQCTLLAHGATGKGNDQVRLELTLRALSPPGVRVLAPWREPAFLQRFKGRRDMLAFVAERGIKVEATAEKPYSMDENMAHCSYEAGVLEDPQTPALHDMFRLTASPYAADRRLEPELLRVHFEQGRFVRAELLAADDAWCARHAERFFGPDPWQRIRAAWAPVGRTAEGAVPVFRMLNEIGGRHGVGRIDIVENRFVGIKSRGVYDAPAHTILMCAHRDVEGLTLDRDVVQLRDSLSMRYAQLMYDGQYHSAVMEVLLAALEQAQRPVNGWSIVVVHSGHCMAIARHSPTSSYDEAMSSMDIEGGFSSTDSSGFIAINSIRLVAYNRLKRQLQQQQPK